MNDNYSPKRTSPVPRSIWLIVLLHTIAMIVMLIEFIIFMAVPLDATLIQTTSFLTPGEGPMGTITTETISGSPRIAVLISVFVACAALDHFVCVCIGIGGRKLATSYIFDKQCNPLRWIEYAVSAAVMMVLLVGLCGVRDIFVQLLCGCLTSVCMLIGWVMESTAPRRSGTGWALFAIASFACMVPWVVLLAHFAAATGAPVFVWFAMLGTMMAFALFAVNMACYHLAKLYSFAICEALYIVLSISAKSYLAFVVWGGFLATSN